MLTRTLSIVNPLSVGKKRKHSATEDDCESQFKALKECFNESFGLEFFRKKVQDESGDDPEDVMQNFAAYDQFCRDTGDDRMEECLDVMAEMIDFINKQHLLLEEQRTLILALQEGEKPAQEVEKGAGAAEEANATEESQGGPIVIED